jgi:hypothetical protein
MPKSQKYQLKQIPELLFGIRIEKNTKPRLYCGGYQFGYPARYCSLLCLGCMSISAERTSIYWRLRIVPGDPFFGTDLINSLLHDQLVFRTGLLLLLKTEFLTSGEAFRRMQQRST